MFLLFFFQAEDGIRVHCVTGVQTCALPILTVAASVRDTVVARNLAYIQGQGTPAVSAPATPVALVGPPTAALRSEEHTSELQSHSDLVCRLLLEKKKKKKNKNNCTK